MLLREENIPSASFGGSANRRYLRLLLFTTDGNGDMHIAVFSEDKEDTPTRESTGRRQ